MKTNQKVINYFSEKPEVKRIKELESFIDNNKEIEAKYNELLELQKLMVSSKEFHQVKQYNMYMEEYEKKKNEFFDLPFVYEYIECLNIVSDDLENYKELLEKRIKSDID